MKYIKKPSIVDAEQWFPGKEIPGVITQKEDSSFLIAMNMEGVFDHAAFIDTNLGEMIVLPGDWIITEESGEQYPCKNYIFEQTYEKCAEILPQQKLPKNYTVPKTGTYKFKFNTEKI